MRLFAGEMSDYNKAVKDVKDEGFIDRVEKLDSASMQIDESDNIETTAASKAAWLIAVTVSIGGFLFGRFFTPNT